MCVPGGLEALLYNVDPQAEGGSISVFSLLPVQEKENLVGCALALKDLKTWHMPVLYTSQWLDKNHMIAPNFKRAQKRNPIVFLEGEPEIFGEEH